MNRVRWIKCKTESSESDFKKQVNLVKNWHSFEFEVKFKG